MIDLAVDLQTDPKMKRAEKTNIMLVQMHQSKEFLNKVFVKSTGEQNASSREDEE